MRKVQGVASHWKPLDVRTLAPGGVFLRTVLFSTYMVPMIAVALVFSKLYSPTEGPLNQILGWVGIPPQTWLSAPQTALGSIVIPATAPSSRRRAISSVRAPSSATCLRSGGTAIASTDIRK